MASSDVEICNSALIKVGAKPIITLNDDSTEGRLCNTIYPVLKAKLLRSHPWNFAIRRAELSIIITDPVFEFENAFQLPVDVLRVLNLEDPTVEYQVEGKLLLSDATEIFIRYISAVDEGDFDANFQEVLAVMIASEIVYSLSESNALRESLKNEFILQLRDARSFDAQEGTPQQVVARDWIDSRGKRFTGIIT